jgi:membrane associated rhomboid family serine protease
LAAKAKSALWGNLRRAVWIMAVILSIIWLVALVDTVVFAGHLRAYGIVPRTERGLVGILFAPLLHDGLGHLIGNTSGILIFGGLVLLRKERDFWSVTLIGALTSGIGTWLFGRAAVHIGASGVIFAYFGYLLVTGLFERRLGALALSALVFFIWWPTLWGLMPGQLGISWEGHLFGLCGGVLAAWLLSTTRR